MRLGELLYKFQRVCHRYKPQRKTGIYATGHGGGRGRALVSYLPLPLIGDSASFRGHSNVWECSEIVRIFNRLGYVVDLIAWDDSTFVPHEPYDVVFDIHRNLFRCAGKNTRTIFHVTGSNLEFSNRAEGKRIAELRSRRGVTVDARRTVGTDGLSLFAQSLQRADLITLIGNDVTEGTFPVDVRKKIRKVVATGAWLPRAPEHAPIPPPKTEFLWFNGGGAVHKGLDLVLEVFASHPELTLHVVGPYLKERDFVDAYRNELFRTPNIRSHGFHFPSDRRFLEIASRTRAFVSPSCSEGISTSAITCMQAGMVPIISRNCGVSLPENSGILLDDCRHETIERAVLSISSASSSVWQGMATTVRQFALKTYSRDVFSREMTEAIDSLFH